MTTDIQIIIRLSLWCILLPPLTQVKFLCIWLEFTCSNFSSVNVITSVFTCLHEVSHLVVNIEEKNKQWGLETLNFVKAQILDNVQTKIDFEIPKVDLPQIKMFGSTKRNSEIRLFSENQRTPIKQITNKLKKKKIKLKESITEGKQSLWYWLIRLL